MKESIMAAPSKRPQLWAFSEIPLHRQVHLVHERSEVFFYKQMPASFCLSEDHVQPLSDSPYTEQRFAITWEQRRGYACGATVAGRVN
jgi:hypothetical protein